MIDALLLLVGLALLLGGGDLLVRGSSALALRLGVTPSVVGLTVVAFGTSAPELVVCTLAATGGSGSIAFGNVVGSNIANVALLLGATALVAPIAVQGAIVTREIPMMVLAGLSALALGLDGALSGGELDRFSRGDGAMLLLLFGVFLYYTLAEVFRRRGGDPLLEGAEQVPPVPEQARLPRALVQILLGLVGLVVGGHLLIGSARTLALAAGVPEVVVGLTVVAVGTSMPELATSLIAARRGQADLALGNIVGSNIFNVLLILGTTATIRPVEVPPGGWVDLVVNALLAIALLPMAITHRRRITRGEGGFLVLVYAGYLVYQATR